MEVRAVSKSVRISPRKVRLLADAVKNLSVEEALTSLTLYKKRGSIMLEKTLKSAVANATNNSNLKREDLTIKTIDVLESPAYKRYHASTRGRIHPYKKRGSHVTIVLTDNKSEIQNQKSETNKKIVNVQNPKEETKKEAK